MGLSEVSLIAARHEGAASSVHRHRNRARAVVRQRAAGPGFGGSEALSVTRIAVAKRRPRDEICRQIAFSVGDDAIRARENRKCYMKSCALTET